MGLEHLELLVVLEYLADLEVPSALEDQLDLDNPELLVLLVVLEDQSALDILEVHMALVDQLDLKRI